MAPEIELPPPLAHDPYEDPLAVAVAMELSERGYENVTIEDVVRRAGSSREEFDARFSDLDDCALKAYENFTVIYKRRAGSAFNEHDRWRDALRAAACETADWMVEKPFMARFGIVEVQKLKSGMGLVRREEIFAWCSEMIDAGRSEAPDPAQVPDSAPTMAVGSIIQLLSHRVQEGSEIKPHDVIPELMYGVVRVYLGEEEAREELLPRK